ncbi:MAG: DUF348 domain-containing protein [Chloroflexi bacterium]|nr:DUF348 domain-containing protein [Chloroflexota bacterium]
MSLAGLSVAAGLALMAWPAFRHSVFVQVNGAPPWVATVWGATVGAALHNAHVDVYPQDKVFPGLDAPLKDGLLIQVWPARPVEIHAADVVLVILTAERVPANILRTAGFRLYAGDQVLADGLPVDPQAEAPASGFQVLELRPTLATRLTRDKETLRLFSPGPTLAQALQDNQIKLYASDLLQPPPETLLVEGLTAGLASGQVITVQIGERSITTRAAGATVGQALASAGLSLQGLDYSIPAEGLQLPSDGKIRVVRVREEIALEQTLLAFETQLQPMPEVEIDTLQVVQAGEYGLKAQRVRIRFEDGEEVSRSVEDEWVARQPVARVQGYGTKIVIRTANTPDGTIEYWRAVEVYATSYAPANAGTPVDAPNYGITYSGQPLRKGHIAVIRSWYPYLAGWSFYVPGYGIGTVADIGGGFPDRHWIDLGYTDAEYVAWHEYVTLYFLTPVPPEDQILWVLP